MKNVGSDGGNKKGRTLRNLFVLHFKDTAVRYICDSSLTITLKKFFAEEFKVPGDGVFVEIAQSRSGKRISLEFLVHDRASSSAYGKPDTVQAIVLGCMGFSSGWRVIET